MKIVFLILLALAGTPAFGADEAAIIATLTHARKVQPTGDGFQLVSQNGAWMRAV